MASELISIAGMLRMKNSTIRLAKMLPRIRCSSSEAIEASMKRESSWVVAMVRPGGSDG